MNTIQKPPQWAIDLAAREKAGKLTEIDMLWKFPERIFKRRQMVADLWQMECLKSRQNLLLNCSRQVGKSEVTAGIALLAVLREPPSLILILSPTDRQSVELLKTKFMPMYEPWERMCPLVKDNEFSKEFANGSRVIALPGKNEGNVRSYSSVSLLIIDEASRVMDSLYDAVTPMLAVSKGRKIVLSTPFGKRGWFYKQWMAGGEGKSTQQWKKIRILAEQCSRLTPEFLANEKEEKGERVYRQEYCGSFEEAVGSLFPEWAIEASLRDDITPLNLFEDVAIDIEDRLEPIIIETERLKW